MKKKVSRAKTHLGQMKALTEQAERWDLEPKPASLWWTSNHAHEMMGDNTISSRAGQHKVLFVKCFKILGYTFKQDRRKIAWWEECKMQTRLGGEIDVPWRVKCRRWWSRSTVYFALEP